MRITSLAIAAIVILAAPVAAGCGSDDDGGDGREAAAPAPTATQTAAPAAIRALTIRMTEFAFDPKDALAKAGSVTITAPNDGKVVHELVLLKTDEDPAALPRRATRSTRARLSARSPTWSRIDQEGDVQARAGQLRDGLRATGPLPGWHVWIADGRVAGFHWAAAARRALTLVSGGRR